MGVEQQRPCLLQLVKENWEEITANGQIHHIHFLSQNHLLVLKRCCIILRLKVQQLLRVNCDGLTSQFFTNMFNPLDLSKQKKLLDLVYMLRLQINPTF